MNKIPLMKLRCCVCERLGMLRRKDSWKFHIALHKRDKIAATDNGLAR